MIERGRLALPITHGYSQLKSTLQIFDSLAPVSRRKVSGSDIREHCGLCPAIVIGPCECERLVQTCKRSRRIPLNAINVSDVGERRGLDAAVTYRARYWKYLLEVIQRLVWFTQKVKNCPHVIEHRRFIPAVTQGLPQRERLRKLSEGFLRLAY